MMSLFESMMAGPWGEVLGWTLVHFVWQGGVVALLLVVALFFLRQRSPQARYAVACGAMVLLLLLPIVTASVLYVPASEPLVSTLTEASASEVAVPLPASTSSTVAEVSVTWSQRVDRALGVALPWMVSLWMMGVFVLSLRYLIGWGYTIRLRRQGAGEIGQQWQNMLARLSEQLGLKRVVRLYTSNRIQVPTVVGWFRPVILVPISIFSGLTTQQVEMVIAHELAHIRRYDAFVNLLQALCETVLFYHPAVWWISNRIRVEREHCCDDLVVTVCGHAPVYADALARLETLRPGTTQFALAATDGSLLDRVRRLLGMPAKEPVQASRWVVGMALLGLLTFSIYLSSGMGLVWNNPMEWMMSEETTPWWANNDTEGSAHLFITVHGDEPVLLEHVINNATPRATRLRGPHVEIGMPVGARLVVDDLNGPTPVGKIDDAAGTMTFEGDLEMEVWKEEALQFKVTVHASTVVYKKTEGRYRFGQSTLNERPHILNERPHILNERPHILSERPLVPQYFQGYEKTAVSLEALIFEDESRATQLEALDEIRKLPSRDALSSLMRLAEKHEREVVRNEAVQWIGRKGNAFVVPTLERIAFTDASPSVQMEALDALRNLKDNVGLSALVKLAQTHTNPEMRNEAVQWIGRLGDASARNVLEQIVFEDGDEGVQREALDALGALPDGAGVSVLKRVVNSHRNTEIRLEALDQEAKGILSQWPGLVRSFKSLEGEWVQLQKQRAEASHPDEEIKIVTQLMRERAKVAQALELERATLRVLEQQQTQVAGDEILLSATKLRIVEKHLSIKEKEAELSALEDRLVSYQKKVGDLLRASIEQKQQEQGITVVSQWQQNTLSRGGYARTAELLETLILEDEDLATQLEALDALMTLPTQRRMDSILRVVQTHPQVEVRLKAVGFIGVHIAAGAIELDNVAPMLEELVLGDASPDIQMKALDAIGALPEELKTSILKQIRQRHSVEEVKAMASSMLEA